MNSMAHNSKSRRTQFSIFLLGLFMILPSTDAFVGRSPGLNIRLQQSRISPLFVSKSGARLIKTAEMYETTILQESASRPVLVFFSAPWCGPCRLTNPVVKDVKQQFSGEIDVVEVCTDDLAEIAEQAGVVSIPTIQFYYQGEKMDTIVGCVAKSVLANAVSKVLEGVSQIKTKTS